MSEKTGEKASFGHSSTTEIVVDLINNEVKSSSFSNRVKEEYAKRLESNNDYRQAMLSYCLKEVAGDSRDRIIQSLLPERLFNTLCHVEKLILQYPLANLKPAIIATVEVSKIDIGKGLVKFVINGEKEEAVASYKIGGRRIAMIGECCQSFGRFQEILKPYYEITTIVPSDDNLVTRLIDCIEDLSVVLVCSKVIEVVEQIKSEPRLKDVPIGLMSSEEVLESQLLFKEGINDILNIQENPELIIHRVQNLSMIRDYTATIEEYQIDKKTGLLNREFFLREAEKIVRCGNEKEYVVTLFAIQSFDLLKEKYGDAVGDIIVKYVKNQFASLIPDIKMMGRYSSDKFIILRYNKPITTKKDIIGQIKKGSPISNLILKTGIAPISLENGLKYAITCAEIAIESIKNNYGCDIAMFDEKMREEQQMKEDILSSMERALESGQFEVYYQPKHKIEDNSIYGAEALVRWNNPKYGVMEPGKFLPLFERTGFVRGLDRFIIARVLQDMNEWRARGISLHPVSVNLSRRDFETGDIADWIINLVNRFSIDPKLLQIEVTESAFIDNPTLIASCVSKLHESGFVIELDDFGTGYSSLITLNDLDVDILKIDKSILYADQKESKKSVLVFSLELAKVLGMKSVVEGIETEEQLDRIKELGATVAQGFYFSKPIPKQEYEKYIRK